MLEINELVEGKIDTIAFGGEGILRHKGMVIFIPFTAPGDQVTCRITELRKSFAKGVLVTIHQPGPNRISPLCPYFGTCGGCQIQHLNDAGQDKYKYQAVQDALLRIGHLKIEKINFIPAQQKWAYRRHITLHLKPYQNAFQAGYISTDNTSLIVIKKCPIFNEPEDSIVLQIQSLVKQLPNPSNHEGRVIILKAENGQYILSFHFDEQFQIEFSRFNHALQEYPIFKGILVTIGKSEKSFGDPHTEIVVDHLTCRISPQTFIQNHPEQTVKIYKQIVDLVNKGKNKKILDLYCGFGMISQLLSKQGHTVSGIEYNKDAIKFAKESTLFNKLHTQFIQGDVERLLSKVAKEMKPDTIIVNPPRVGLAKEVLTTLLRVNPNEIIYVSCMPATLARDLAVLCRDKYEIQQCAVYDMFPQTAHIETLVHLIKKEA